MRVAFLHPELRIGGAERVVVDAALDLQRRGHEVTVFTAHLDRDRCLEEARNGSLDVRVRGEYLPADFRGRLRAPCSILRTAFLAFVAGRQGRFDVVFMDFVPDAISLVKALTGAPVMYYCHFPDRLPLPRGFLYDLYRIPLDRLEAAGIAVADRVFVNSRFTAAEFRKVYPYRTPEVLYPGIEIASQDQRDCVAPTTTDVGDILLLSVSRFERKKNLSLALDAMALLRARVSDTIWARLQLVLAGAYESGWREAREVLSELQARTRGLGLENHVVFKPSCSDGERAFDLSRCFAVLYTPHNEPFGLVPIEAMAAGKPVVAVNSGGPLETILDAETGLLCDPKPDAFADAVADLLARPDLVERMGRTGRKHVRDQFSRAAFGARLENILHEMIGTSRRAKQLAHRR